MKTQISAKKAAGIDTKILMAEFLSLFAITYVSSWAVIFHDLKEVSQSLVALAYALTVMAFTWFVRDISGAHMNPAITIGMMVIKRIGWTNAAFYISSQFLGGIVAAFFIYMQMDPLLAASLKGKSGLGIPTSSSSEFEMSGFWSEVMGSLILVLVFLALVHEAKKHKSETTGGLAMCFAIYSISLTFGELSGPGLNPARALGPAIVIGRISRTQFIHFFGPIIGATIGALLYAAVFFDEDDDERDEIPAQSAISTGLDYNQSQSTIMQYNQSEIQDLK